MRRYGVRQLTLELDRLIAGRYPQLEVEAEISQVSVPASGHAYLTLADADAVLGAVCWRDAWRGLAWRPQRGDKVVCRGRLGVYGGKGAYQLYVHHIARAGEGALAAELARRRAALEAEGLLDPRRKRALPAFPRVVGVATSLTGAALQDFLKVSGQRFPATRVLVAGCTVQGDKAPGSVILAVERLVEDGRAEVIVVTRGGGSKEDLLAFQDEQLARYLAHCPVPVVSAVGHQVDTTLCDLVADVVAPTPTAAAVAVLPDGPALAQRVDDAALALGATVARLVAVRRQRVDGLAARLRHPRQRLDQVRRRADELAGRAGAVMARGLVERRRGVQATEDRLQAAMQRYLERRVLRLERLEMSARALSPVGVLARGYAVVVGPHGVLTRVGDAAPGDALAVRVADGVFHARVEADGAEPV